MDKANFYTDTRVKLMASQTADSFINDIYVITMPGNNCLTTRTLDKKDGFYKDLLAEIQEMSSDSNTIKKWISHHDTIDETYGVNSNSYFLSFAAQSSQKMGYVAVDVSSSAVRDLLSGMDLGDGSIIGFVTDDGKEIDVPEMKRIRQYSSMKRSLPDRISMHRVQVVKNYPVIWK